MIDDARWIATALALSFTINLVPAFMPSTWMVLAFFYIRYDVPLLPLTVGGAVVSGLGRLVLAQASTRFKRRFMHAKADDLDELGGFLDEHRQYAGAVVFLYALSPLPTNNLFIAAGMAEVRIAWVLAGFWSARILADTFWVWTTNRAFDGLGDVFADTLRGPVGITLQVAGLLSVYLLYRLSWARWLRRLTNGPRRQPP
ncbi:MAG: hypothetical protein WEC75_03960 [Dehalococcoidia bacterium]